ncbi:MAG: type II toxin-antitoxin system VapC family toxin [Candidatus Promineifilaceae bacterium]|nr:type II toxin-antitoxin system VapC family toxin [Candidatus Promineifilaceae bacterium]
MILPDVNVLVYAHRADAPRHADYLRWLIQLIQGDSAYGMSDIVLSGFIRVVTHPRIFNPPSALEDALSFASELRTPPNCLPIRPGPRHWSIFTRLCRRSGVKGNLVPDAYLAALSIESGCEWASTDRDFSRFPGLKWFHPLLDD